MTIMKHRAIGPSSQTETMAEDSPGVMLPLVELLKGFQQMYDAAPESIKQQRQLIEATRLTPTAPPSRP